MFDEMSVSGWAQQNLGTPPLNAPVATGLA